MITMAKLRAKTRARTSEHVREYATIKLGHDEPIERLFFSLQDFFAADENRQGIQLIFPSTKARYLHRADVLALANVDTRGVSFGDSDGAVPAGQGHYRLIEVCCKKAGCTHRYWVTNFDEDEPPLCDAHTKVQMRLCDESD